MLEVKKEIGAKLTINWRYFSLEQINNDEGPEWKVWLQSADYPGRGLNAFRAAEAARRQGEAAFTDFHIALYRAKHEEYEDIADINTLNQIAEDVNLDMGQFKKDFGDDKILNRLETDHTHATETIGVFGTPTLVFPENQAVFLKMSPPPPEDSLPVFNEIRAIAVGRQYVLEIKRP